MPRLNSRAALYNSYEIYSNFANTMKFITTIFILVFAHAGMVYSASDGSIGTTSTGNASLFLTMPKLIRFTGFIDFSGTWDLSNDLNWNQDLRVSTNYGTAAREYSVVATGSGTGGAFTITDGVATIAYSVWFNDQTGTTGRVALTSGTPLSNQTGATKPLSTATLNANISATVTNANMSGNDAGIYSGTLSVIVTPI